MIPVIMAGGQGTRLRPLTCEQPKPLLTVGNRPVLTHVVDLLSTHGFDRAIVTVRYRWQQLADEVGTRHRNVRLDYIPETVPLGTAGSVRHAIGNPDEPILVLSGDALTDFNLQTLIDHHKSSGAAVTIGLSRAHDPSQYGVVETANGGRITRFLEKPAPGTAFTDQINTGIYVIEPDVFSCIPRGEEYDFARDLFPRLLSDGIVMHAVLSTDYWCDIGDCRQYLQANIDTCAGKIDVNASSSTDVSISESAFVDDSCIIGADVIIERGAKIGPNVTIGRGSIIGAGAELTDCVIGKETRIGPRCELTRTIVASRAILGQDVACQEGVVVGNRVHIGDHSTLRPGVRVWPDRKIYPAAIVTNDIVRGSDRSSLLLVDGVVEGDTGSELGPEVVASVARAASYLYGRNRPVIVGSAGDKVSREMRRAAVAGAVAGGGEAIDTGTVIKPALTSLQTALQAPVGIYITTRGENQRRLRIEIVGSDGQMLIGADNRKFASAISDDIAPVRPEDYRPVRVITDADEIYLNNLLANINIDAVKRLHLRLVLAYETDPAGKILEAICRRCGIEPVEGLIKADYSIDRDPLSGFVAHTDADGGGWITGDGTGLRLSTGKGMLSRDDMILLLAKLLISSDTVDDVLYVPVDATLECEMLAQDQNIDVHRVHTPPAQSCEHLLWADGLAQLLLICSYCAETGQKISDLVPSRPNVATRRTWVQCPVEMHPRIMKSLAEHAARRPYVPSGVVLSDSRGWAHIRPDPRSARLRIVCHGDDMEIAGEISADLTNQITSLITREGDDNAAGDRR